MCYVKSSTEERNSDLADLDMGTAVAEAKKIKQGNTQRHSVLMFVVLCLLVAGLPLFVTTTYLLNGIELPKLALLFLGTGVLVSIRLWQNG